ncbi:MAG: RHS repeat-associated core domain-containing protein [Planctomycetota bacterium]|nr:MAG: RHS repeat-associated core domain-containing protein [Planctomycetota bacterium]REJ90756.1 MAG: RHS repeat-associated core domain-containing protein [Planctomycetota bacterium]
MNVTGLVDASTGLVVERYHYDSYGRVEFLSDVFASLGTQATQYGNDFLYTGRKLDAETGQMYYRGRYYCDPSLGRFVQRDPIGYAAGDSNLYRYVSNSPLNAVDPWGLAERKILEYGDFEQVDSLELDGDHALAEVNHGGWVIDFSTGTIAFDSSEEQNHATARAMAEGEAKKYNSRVFHGDQEKIDALIRELATRKVNITQNGRLVRQEDRPCNCTFVAVARYSTPPEVSFPGGAPITVAVKAPCRACFLSC